ncbi:PepSY domain-containing protein [Aquimarina sp. AD10]|uniref:PepSY-associated TM helix domain-containing protein n=1 Tax=Aquimarina sp. AD10 TaxID=1714849 RepID=UPI000E4DDEB1|nr:PepSY-associated TM helix domain-containing protein [Aquimarina sp. AD10]AXT62698.1 PepSY domain-containing protein [Aquimarina sp. AD10]RKN01881.1 PepSY domain-containing protein [Aquimarina sp. AD10]
MKTIKKNKKANRRKTILQLHKILGLITGVVLFIVSITGCLWVFKDEIESFYDDYKYVTPRHEDFITASNIKKIAEEIIPNKTIHGVIYGQSNEAIEVVFYEAEPEIFYHSVFLDPYSGDFIKRVNNNSGFFGFILKGHLRLWLPDAIGSRVVSYSVLMFLIIMISGLFLWWPRNKKNWRQRLKFDWNSKTRWKRKNFDLHTVTGFYVSSLGLLLAFTGCVMAFNWFYFIAYKVSGGDKAPQFIIPNSTQSYVIESEDEPAYNKLVPLLQQKYTNAVSYELHYPENDTTSILVEVSNSKGLYYNMDYLFFDQNTLQELETTSIYGKYKDAKFADKVIRMNYDIHIGAIGGIVGKIIAFLVSLLCASLPVSGVLLWYGRTYKKHKKTSQQGVLV